MTLKYSLDEDDFLQHSLFTATKSERIKKKRRKNWIMVTSAVFCLALIFYFSENMHEVYYWLIFGVITLFFYPSYEKYQYKKHYQKYIAETYKNRFNETSTVIFDEDNIETSDRTGEMKINLSEIEKIIETTKYFYLKMKTGETLIIPKFKIENLDNLRNILEKLAIKLNINFEDDLNWKW